MISGVCDGGENLDKLRAATCQHAMELMNGSHGVPRVLRIHGLGVKKNNSIRQACAALLAATTVYAVTPSHKAKNTGAFECW